MWCCSGEEIVNESDFIMIMTNDIAPKQKYPVETIRTNTRFQKSHVGHGGRYESPKKMKKNPLLNGSR